MNKEDAVKAVEDYKDKRREALLADLRNKLSPIQNHLALQRDLDSRMASSNEKSFLDGFHQGKCEELIRIEKIKAERCMAQIIIIIEQLENL